MVTAVLMPKLGLTMESATILRWHIQEGERLKQGELLAEIETDKTLSEVRSPASGVLLKVIVPEGADANVRTVLAIIGEPGEDWQPLAANPGDE